MLIGARDRFAVEAELRDASEGWLWGGFRFWLGNVQVGNWDDAAALHLCWGWLKKFAEKPPQCVEPAVAASSATEVFRLIVEPVFGPGGIADPRKQPVPFAYERFHIGHVEMSSFDSFVVVLVKDERGKERCLWQKADDTTIGEQWLDPNEMERVVAEFCERFRAAHPQISSASQAHPRPL